MSDTDANPTESFADSRLTLQPAGMLFAPASLRLARLHGASLERASYFAGLGHDQPLTPAESSEIDRLLSVLGADIPLTTPDESEPLVTRLNIGNTYYCNMGCTYCYNELGIKDRKGSEVPDGMSLETSRQAIIALLDQAPPARPLSLVFIGGEALLEFKTLRQVVGFAKSRCEAAGHPLSVAVYTNGTLMTRSVIEWSNANDVSLVVSLDGPPNQNDTYRIFRAGRPTSPAVLRNIRTLMELSTQVVRRVRAVAVRSVDLVALHQYLLDLGFNEIHVQAMYSESGIDTGDFQAMVDLLAWYIDKLASGIILSVLPFENFFERFMARGKAVTNWYPCTAGRTSLGVGPDGRVYPCHHFLEESAFEVGHVADGLPSVESRRNLFVRVDGREPCSSCWARHACGGECYHRAHTAGQGYTGVLPDVCRERKSYIGLALDAFAQLVAEHPAALKALAAKRYSPVPIHWDAFGVRDLAEYRERA